MRSSLGRRIAVLTLACVLAVPLPSALASPPRSGLSTDLQALVDAGAPGALLFVRDHDRVLQLTAGYGEIASQTPMRPRDHFKIASLTKTYTAAVVLQLVGANKLRLSDRLEQYVPGLVPGGDKITIKQLLQHTSGIPDFETDPRYLAPYLNGDFGYYWSPRQLVEIAISYPPVFPPGETETSSYSNTNYVLLGLVVEAVTGRPIGDVLRSRLFRPLHLDETTYPTAPGLPEPYAHGYLVVGAPPPIDVTGLSPSLSPASGAIVSTTRDVADFYRALLAGHVITPQLLQAMKTTIPARRFDIPGQSYGLGLEKFPTPCGPAWGHNGTVPGYYTYIFASEHGQREAVLMVNHDASTLPLPAAERFLPLITKAYCANAH
jgi:D-alanyl-D-alanine carboxypeptidase